MALMGGTYSTVYVEQNPQHGPTNERRIVLCIFYSNGYGLERTHHPGDLSFGLQSSAFARSLRKRPYLWYFQISPGAHSVEPSRTHRYQ